MSSDALSIAALCCFAAGAVVALLGFRVEALRNSFWQILTVGLGVALKTAAIGMGCAERDTHFFSSRSEIFGLLAWALACSYLLALVISAARSLGALVLPVVTLVAALAQFASRNAYDPGIPPGRLFATHIISAFFGYGMFLTACGASVLYLEGARLLKRKTFGAIFKDLPSLERLERLEMLCSWSGLATFTVALATGAVLARRANQPFWFEPKVLAAQLTWFIFVVLVIGRAIRRLSGRSAARVVLAGAGLVLLTFALGHPIVRQAVSGSSGSVHNRNAEAQRAQRTIWKLEIGSWKCGECRAFHFEFLSSNFRYLPPLCSLCLCGEVVSNRTTSNSNWRPFALQMEARRA